MFTLCWWAVIILPILFRTQTYFYPTNIEIMAIILSLGMELMIFFDMPGSKFLKNSDQFTLKTTVLSKIVSENEEKIKNIRFAIFILTALILTITKCSGIICWSLLIFLFCTNLDIALTLASPEERKLYWQKFRTENLHGTLIGLAILLGILAIWRYFFK